MIYDLRNHQVPMPLTIGGLICAGIFAFFNHLWTPVLLMIALILVSDFKPREKRLAFASTLFVFAAIFQPDTIWICFVIALTWLFWEFGVLGGADVKLLVIASLLFGNAIFLIPIVVTGGIQGVIATLQKKKEIPFVVSIFLGTLLYVLFPYF